MKKLAALITAFALLGTAQATAGQPFVPGQVRSQALAMRVWHPNCAWVGVTPLRPEDVRGDTPFSRLVGLAWPDQCHIALNPSAIREMTRTDAAWTTHRAFVREEKIMACTVIVHEYGHLAGYFDSVGAPLPDGSHDHDHSPDLHNVMAPYQLYSYPPCRTLFPRTHKPRRPGR